MCWPMNDYNDDDDGAWYVGEGGRTTLQVDTFFLALPLENCLQTHFHQMSSSIQLSLKVEGIYHNYLWKFRLLFG